MVEIDPFDPAAAPRKRTALGRMNHEGCWPGKMVAGVRPAFYMGDDATNEYIYKFVSATPWAAADAGSANCLAMGDKYLDAGTLYVAKFNADGSGQWVALVFGQNGLTSTNATYAFADQADVLTHCRLAGDIVGATKMDRPEWTAVNPVTGEMYRTLTNNSTRTTANTDAANPRAYTDVTNCMLLAAIPGSVGDGGARTITNTITPATGGSSTGTATTRIGKAPGTALRRFLVGPKECEITGIDSTPDGRSIFVNIQHPGENATNAAQPTSNSPSSQGTSAGTAPGNRPRSATVVITKDDGGVVGL